MRDLLLIFAIATAGVMDAWSAYGGESNPPSPEEIERAKEAIRKLIDDPDYPLTYGHREPWARPIYVFEGFGTPSKDAFYVYTDTCEVVRAHLNTQADGGIRPGFEGRFWLPADYAMRKALRIARQNCPGFDDLHMVLQPPRVPGVYEWWAIDPETGARLPSRVCLKLDPINGSLISWDMERLPVDLPLRPRLTAEQAVEIVRQTYEWARGPASAKPGVYALRPGQQELIWKVTVELEKPMEVGLFVVDDATGKIRSVIGGPPGLKVRPEEKP